MAGNSRKYLLVGKRRTHNNPSEAGGAIILFEQLCKDFERFELEYVVIDTNYRNYRNKLVAYLSICCNTLIKSMECTCIILNGSNNATLLFGPVIYFLNRLFNKNYIIRIFGGNFYSYYRHKNKISELFITHLLKSASLIFLEQKYQVDKISSLNKNTHWFPNMRNPTSIPEAHSSNRYFKGQFVFISHVREEKGVNELLKVKQELKDEFELQIYGPLVNYTPPEGLSELFKSLYKGVLTSDQVIEKLADFDVLVLPSYKEGYPGIIIEAFSCGTPVIVSGLPSIKEMLQGNEGILIEPGNIASLKKAILSFNEDNYKEYSRNAFKAFDQFNAAKQMPRIIELIESYT